MINATSCKECNHEVKSKDGICSVRSALDNLKVRCVGGWAREKYYYIQRYLEIFTTSMKSKWKLVYIDLFAGCGKCIIRDTEEEIDGSALIALGLKYPFNKYIFIDLNKVALDCLKERAKAYSLCKNISFKEGDCNQIIKKAIINNELPIKDHLYLALIDPTGLQINFDTINLLTQNRRVDIIFIFPEGMAIKRNLEKFLKQQDSPLDLFMGDTK